MDALNRRRFLGGLGVVTGAALSGTLAGCGSSTSISADPEELVLWYWNRSVSPVLLDQAAQEIPGTDKRLRADAIGGGYDNKLRTSLAGGAYIPDIAAINSNCALYFPSEDQFIDLNEFGAADLAADYFEWKWNLGTTPTGRFCFWPMDTGPTGFYYRADIFADAGLPDDPESVGAAITDWDGWIELGQELRANADVAIINTAGMVFNQFLNASPERYFDRDDNPLYEADGSAVRDAWDTAIRASEAGITARLPVANEQNAAWSSGRTAGHIEAVWWANVLGDTAPDTAGSWRVAPQPVRPGNSGGSFLTIPRTCKDPEAAYAFITWLTTPEHQAETYNEVQLFPSAPESFTSGTIASELGFFGEQDPLEFFAEAALQVPTTFVSTYEAQAGAFATELANVEAGLKDPERAWDDAVSQTNRNLTKRGVI
ncbi:ABC transporter substrate-binding protein [Occultella kanbiaonis]|uniref:ABC transporter substrate-binding protein n=1 Tax=Occultella kanbiaonis TaxID=2675754 RepID=UPI001E5FF896|nr:ABC transporter substrate-binding protein [Occultella kanbiaonis]